MAEKSEVLNSKLASFFKIKILYGIVSKYPESAYAQKAAYANNGIQWVYILLHTQ